MAHCIEWLDKGLYVDAKDSVNSWCAAKIIDSEPERVKIHYEGWSEKWEIWLPVKSDKLAPFRLHSRRYTGQNKLAIRDWVLSEAELVRIEASLSALTSSGYAWPAQSITQFLRGELFIAIDCVMTWPYSNKTEFIRSVKFLDTVLDFTVNWLQFIVPLFHKYNSAPQAFLTDAEVAIVAAWPEVNFILLRLFGDDSRCTAFFKVVNYVPQDYQPSDITTMNSERVSKTLLYFGNRFAKMGGLDIVLGILLLQEDEVRPSLEFLQSLPIFSFVSYFSRAYAPGFLAKMKAALLWRLENFSLKELKEYNRDIVGALVRTLAVLSKFTDNRVNQQEIVELWELNLTLKLVACPLLEKRVKGMNELNEIINRVKAKPSDYRTTRWLTATSLMGWIETNQLVELLFSEKSHLELIRRASDVMTFISSCNKLTERHLDLIWTAAQVKHESQAKQTYAVLLELLPRLSVSQCDYLFHKMQEVPLLKYDESFLRLIKDFTAAAFTQMQLARRPFKLYGIPLLHQAMLDSSPVAAFDLASQLLSEVLACPPAEEISWKFLLNCTLLIQEGSSVVQCLKVITSILSSSRGSRFSLSDPVKDKICQLDTHLSGVIPFLLENFAAYISAAKVRAMQPCDLQNLVVQGRYSHKLSVQRRFEFLDFVVLSSKHSISLSSQDIMLLWALFIQNAPSQEDSDTFYRWLYEPRGQAYLFYKETIIEIFSQYLANPKMQPFESLSVEGFTCFWRYFLLVNFLKGSVEIKEARLMQRNVVALEGYAPLKLILLKAEDSKVVQLAISSIVSLHVKVSRAVLAELWQRLLDECLDLIEQNSQNTKAVTRTLELLKAFLEDSPPSDDDQKTSQVMVKLTNQVDYQKIWIDNTKPMATLRHRVARIFNIVPKEVRLTISNIRYSWLDDDLPLTCIKEFAIVNVDRVLSSDISPRDVAAQSQRVLDTLFALLSKPNTAYSELTWNLLSNLPTSPQIKNSLESLDRPISSFLDTSSPHKLLYCLSILADLAKKEAWVNSFVFVGGLESLMDIVLETEFVQVDLSFKFHCLILDLLRRLVGPREVPPNLHKFLRRVLDSLLAVAMCCRQKVFGSESRRPVIAAHFLINSYMKTRSEDLTVYLGQSDQLELTIRVALLQSLSADFSQAVSDMLTTLPIKDKLAAMLVENLDVALGGEVLSEAFFVTLSRCIAECKVADDILESVVKRLTKTLRDRPNEKSRLEKDEVINGVLRTLHAALEVSEIEEAELLHFILHDCLFEVPVKARADRPPKCKNLETRHEAFLVLHSLCKKPSNLEQVVGYLRQLHQDPHWRTSKTMDWHYSPKALEKSETSYVGLKNLGCTCYLNSTLQNLFMIPSFRLGILEAPSSGGLLNQLQQVFAGLQHSERQYVNPKELCAAFTDWEGQPINVNEQKDVFEFAITFIDKLEGELKGTPQENLINLHFGGLQAQELIGKGACSHRSERDEAFLILPLEVKHKNSILDSLKCFVEGDSLEGENAYQCNHCDAKVSALRRTSIRHLPNVLILALRRFEFNFDNMQRVKLNDYCEFPIELDMEPYTLEGLDKLSEQEEAHNKPPESYYKYALKGVLIHMGTADSGHYYTFIKKRDSDVWIDFNDVIVKKFDPAEIPSECFGGEELLSYKGVGSQEISASREKYRNAYMLFYERETHFKPRASGDLPLELLERPKTELLDCSELVKLDNLRYWRCRNSFSPEYFDFVTRLTKTGQPQVFKFVMEFLLTILVRATDRNKLVDFYKLVQQELSQHVEHREWLLEVLSVPQTVKELFLDCPVLEVRRLLVGLVKSALQNVGEEPVQSFIARLLAVLPKAKKPHSRYFAQYFHILSCTVLTHPELITPTQLVQRLLCHLLNDPTEFQDLPSSYKYTDVWLGYDHSSPIETTDVGTTSSETGSHNAYLLYILENCYLHFTPEEIEAFRRPDLIKALVLEGFTKIGARSVSGLYLSLSQDDLEVSKEFLKVVAGVIGEHDYDGVKQYFRLISHCLKHSGELQDGRVDFGLSLFNDVMKLNQQFYTFTVTSLECLFKLALRVPAVTNWYLANSKELRWLETWLQENYYPPAGTNPRTTLFKTPQLGQVPYIATRSNADNIEWLRRLFRGTLGDRSKEWDSDDDFSQTEVKLKQKFDIR
jgi:ubiquitin C-terminal hydrolase